jgi:membrane protein DedA with SNARE-associated domain
LKTSPQSGTTLIPVSRFLAAVALVALVLGVVQLTNIVQLPFVGWLCGPSGSILSSGSLRDFMSSYGYLSLFILMTVESMSVPIPSELILPIAGFLTYEGVLGSLALTLAVSTVAALIGALVDYYVALILGRPFVGGVLRVFRLNPANLDRAERWFERSGQWTVFAARFVPLVRALISFPAGLFRMGLGSFILMTTIGCIVWNGILLYAGFAAGQYLNNACTGPSAKVVVDGFALAVVVGTAAYLVYFGLKSRRARA